MWWAVTALTTVGYGDVYPITSAGKVVACLMAFAGIGFFALPTGIIGSGFVEVMMEAKQAQADSGGESPSGRPEQRPVSEAAWAAAAVGRPAVASVCLDAHEHHHADACSERERLVLQHAADALRNGQQALALVLIEQRLELIGMREDGKLRRQRTTGCEV